MPEPFHIVSLSAFERDVRRQIRKNPELINRLENAQAILKEDPHNTRRQHNIKKLADVKPGGGQWRLRVGDYRIRYDIFGKEVVLYSFRHRRETYGR